MLVRVNGVRLVGDDVGAGEALLFVHAFPLNRRMWAPQLEVLSDRYRCLTVDLRGFGESDTPEGPYPMDQLASDLAGLLDQRGIERATLVGLSMGGYIAFTFWRRFPEKLRALVLADTRAGADTPEGRQTRERLAATAETEGLAPVVQAQVPRLLSAGASPELRQWVQDMIEEASPQGVAGASRGMASRPDSAPLLAGIVCPTLVIVGEQDAVTPPAEAERMASAVPHAQLVRIPVAGHLANLEQPAAFNAALRAFLDGLPKG